MPESVTLQGKMKVSIVYNYIRKCMKKLAQRWVFNHEVINPKNVWISKRIVVFDPKRRCIVYEDC